MQSRSKASRSPVTDDHKGVPRVLDQLQHNVAGLVDMSPQEIVVEADGPTSPG